MVVVVVGGAGGIAFHVAWVQLQDLGWLLHEVVAGDSRGRAQQLLPGLVLIDDDIAGGVTAPPSATVTLRRDDTGGFHRMYGARSLPVQGVRVDVVRTAAMWWIVCHVVVRLGPAGAARTTKKWWRPVVRKKKT